MSPTDLNATTAESNAAALKAFSGLIKLGNLKAADLLSEIVRHPATLSNPSVSLEKIDHLVNKLSQTIPEVALVTMSFRGSFFGRTTVLFPVESAKALLRTLVSDMTWLDDYEISKQDSLCEICNIIISSVAGTVMNKLKTNVQFSVQEFREGPTTKILSGLLNNQGLGNQNNLCLIARTGLSVRNLEVNGDILLTFDSQSLEHIKPELQSFLTGVPK